MTVDLNVGKTDRILRIVLGLVLVGLAVTTADLTGGDKAFVWTAGLVLLSTGATGFCPLYALAGIRTRGRVERKRRTATRR